MKKILLVRHALPNPGSADVSDKERRLRPEGIKQAEQLGKFIQARGLIPDLTLCSDAARTQETVKNLNIEGLNIKTHRGIYLPSAEDILQAIQDVFEDDINTLMIMTHYPGVMEFATDITGNRPVFARGYPECTLSIFETTADSWMDVEKANMTLKQVRIFKPPHSGHAPKI